MAKNWHEPQRPSNMNSVNGHNHNGNNQHPQQHFIQEMSIGLLLGQIITRSDDQVRLLRDIRDVKGAQSIQLSKLCDDVAALPDAIHSKLPKPKQRSLGWSLMSIKEAIHTALALLIVFGLIVGKLAWADLLTVAR